MKQFVIPLVLAAVLLSGVVLLSRNHALPPDLGKISSYEFESAEGDLFRNADLEGKLSVWSFFFTSCQGPCPATQAVVKKLQDELGYITTLQFVSLSIDPETDTPERMREYREKLGGNAGTWKLLRPVVGGMSVESFIVQSFHLGVDLKELIHSTRLVLVDDTGSVRGSYESASVDALDRLRADIDAIKK